MTHDDQAMRSFQQLSNSVEIVGSAVLVGAIFLLHLLVVAVPAA